MVYKPGSVAIVVSWDLMLHCLSGADVYVACLAEANWKVLPKKVIVLYATGKAAHYQTPEYYGIRESPWELAWTVT